MDFGDLGGGVSAQGGVWLEVAGRQSRRSLGNPGRERDNVSHFRVPPIARFLAQAKVHLEDRPL